MIQAVADTHTLIWYLFNDSRLSETARQQFIMASEARMRIGVSTISLVEITYLEEKGRIPSIARRRFREALERRRSVLLELSVDNLVAMFVSRIDRGQIPDMPDRIIAATALTHRVPLISRDRMITTSDIETIW